MDVYIRQGNSFWQLSQLYNIPLQLIVASNRNVQPSQLSIGQKVSIPGFVAINYQIKAGDTLWGIASRRNIDVQAILQINPDINPMALQIGQTIQVPLRITWRIVEGQQEYDFATMTDHLNRLKRVYPFLRISSIGSSVLGNPIPEVLIGNGAKKVHYNGSFHAQEWITTPIIMTFLNDYLLALTNQSSIRGLSMLPLYAQTQLSIVPMVNPDGVNLVLNGPPDEAPWNTRVVEINNGSTDFSGWKANIRGVDLNNQYPAKWEIEQRRKPDEPAPRDYPGPSPLSEPEAVAMADLTRKRDFNRALAFHTQGEVIYWGFENLEPPEARTIVQEFERVSGYQPIQTVDSYAGYKDWFIQEWRRPGFTVELGSGVNPLPLSQYEEIYQESLGIFLVGLYM
ncbi:M14 family metallopeptidase [Paenisporosarcina sp. TG20]|uniref:M14 family metallopeptidase n=1 Tax=Paenisporosarcina sp. TG20 TaxID=1211706 RepID=UPI0002EC5F92|nr:M14 family metallopeptidase [Paenisporosarcina sp. TG20]